MSNIAANIEAIYERINRAAQKVGRNPNNIILVAVTKTHPVETVIAAYQAGLGHFGENRVPEGVEKVSDFGNWLKTESITPRPQWHFIGHLQSRQVGAALAGQFNLIHAVDSVKLAQRINRLAIRDNYPMVEVLLQGNVSGEANKSGFKLDGWQTNQKQLADFYEVINQINNLDRVIIKGLMTMAPWSNNPEEARPTFKSLATLWKKLKVELPHTDWQHLSMGMTDDFEVAIEEGATMIRVGRAIFGQRIY